MLLTTNTTRRCPTVVGHWAIVGLSTLEPLYLLFCVGRIPPAEAKGKVLTGVLTKALTEVPPEVLAGAPIEALSEVPSDAFTIVRSKAFTD